jgi:TetR/AcrR family transcriptional regulator, fatty acid metabolism regulator protein
LPDSVRDLRRGQIVTAARRLVAEQGLDALTIGALEDRLSFTRGVITYHFANKDEIVQAVFTSAIDEIDAAVRREVEGGSTVEDKVRAVLHGNVRGFVDSEVAGRVLLSFWGRLSDAKVRKINAELYAKYRRRAAKLLRAARAEGLIAQVDAGVMGGLLVAIVLGIATQHYFEPGSIDVDAAIQEATRTVMARLQR